MALAHNAIAATTLPRVEMRSAPRSGLVSAVLAFFVATMPLLADVHLGIVSSTITLLTPQRLYRKLDPHSLTPNRSFHVRHKCKHPLRITHLGFGQRERVCVCVPCAIKAPARVDRLTPL